MIYSKEQIESTFTTICNRIEKGESLRSVLRDSDMPSSRTFFKWMDNSSLKVKQYARATDLRAEHVFDEMFDIADDGTNDYMQKMQGGEMVDVLNSEHVQRSKLRIDTRKWALSKMNPKKYGDTSKLDLSSTDGTMTPKANVVVQDAKTADEVNKLIDGK